MTEQQYKEMIKAAIDWQYLIVLAGGMARKSDCDAWLMRRYGIDASTARDITNGITEGPRCFTCANEGVTWHRFAAGRPAPRPEDYTDIDYSVGSHAGSRI